MFYIKKPVSILVNGKIIVRGLISKNAIVWNKHEIFFINKTTFCLLPLCVCLISLVLLQLVEKSSPTCDNSSKMSQLRMMHQVGIGIFLTNWPVDTFFTLLAKGFMSSCLLTNCRGTHWFKTMQPRKMCLQSKKIARIFFLSGKRLARKFFTGSGNRKVPRTSGCRQRLIPAPTRPSDVKQ